MNVSRDVIAVKKPSLVSKNLMQVILSPVRLLMIAVVIAIPPVTVFIRLGSYNLPRQIDFFELGLEMLSLIYPLLVVFIYVAAFSSELTNRFIVYTRVRTDVRNYLWSHALAGAILVFSVFFFAVFLMFLLAFVIEPGIQLISGEQAFSAGSDGFDEAGVTSMTFSQLLAYGAWTYGIVYSAWVGLWAAIISTAAFLLLLLVPNRIVALSLPFVFFWIENIVLSYAGFPEFRTTIAIFPFGFVQQPIWTAFVPLAWWIPAILGLTFMLRRRRFAVEALV